MTDQAGSVFPTFEVVRPDWPSLKNVNAFTTLRAGGFSKGRWAALNLGNACGDDPVHVGQNRDLLQSFLPSDVHWLRQVHGKKVLNRDDFDGTGIEADAIFSHQRGQVCAVLTADCLPVLFCNRSATKIAAAHAGWRGLAAGILEATVLAMECSPGELMAWLGPAIGPTVYEVGEEVYQSFVALDAENASAFSPSGNRWFADLYALARRTLSRVGVGLVTGGQYCTYSQPDKFFSYRRDGTTGRMASVIWLA